MKKRVLALLLCFLVLLPAFACGAAGAGGAPPAPPRQTLTIYTSHPEDVYGPIVKEFEERTGIWTTVVTGNTLDLLESIRQDGDAPIADVMFGGGAESHNAYGEHLQSYASPGLDGVSSVFKSEDSLWTPFSALTVVFIYNTKLLTAKNAPTGWADIIDPKWNGMVAFTSPATSASSFTAVSTLMQVFPQEGWAEMEMFLANVDGCLLTRSADVSAAVADGSFPVGIALEEVAQRYVKSGSDIAIVYPVEGTSVVPDATSLVKGAPNGQSARKFIDFTVSLDAQQMLVHDMSRRTVRTDIENSKGLAPLGEIAILPYDYEFAARIRKPVLDYWRQNQQ